MVMSAGVTSCFGQLPIELARCKPRTFQRESRISSSDLFSSGGTLYSLKKGGDSACWHSVARPFRVRCEWRNDYCRGALSVASGAPRLGWGAGTSCLPSGNRLERNKRVRSVTGSVVSEDRKVLSETEKEASRENGGSALKPKRPLRSRKAAGSEAKAATTEGRKIEGGLGGGSETGAGLSVSGKVEDVEKESTERRGIVARNPEVRERLQLLRSKYLKPVVKNGVSVGNTVTDSGLAATGGASERSKGAELLDVLRRNREAETEMSKERREQSDVSKRAGEVSISGQSWGGAQARRKAQNSSAAQGKGRPSDFYTVVDGSKVSKLEARAMPELKRPRAPNGSLRNGLTAGKGLRPTRDGREVEKDEERPSADVRVRSAWKPARKEGESSGCAELVAREGVGDVSATWAAGEKSALGKTSGVGLDLGSRKPVSEQVKKDVVGSNIAGGGKGKGVGEGTRSRVKESSNTGTTGTEKPLGGQIRGKGQSSVNALVAERKDSSVPASDAEESDGLVEDSDDEDEGVREPTAAELAEEERERAQFTPEELEAGEKLEFTGLAIDLDAETDDVLAGMFDVETETSVVSGVEEREGLREEEGLEKGVMSASESEDESEAAISKASDSEVERPSLKELTPLERARILFAGGKPALAAGRETDPPDSVKGEVEKPPLEGLTPLERTRVLFVGGKPALAAGRAAGRETTPPEAIEDQPERPFPELLEGLTPLERARILFAGGKPALAAGREAAPPEQVDPPVQEVMSLEAKETSAVVRRRPAAQKKAPAKKRRGRKEEEEMKGEPIKTRAQAVEYIKQLARDTFRDFLQMRLADRLRVDYIVNHCPKFLARHVLLPLSRSKDRQTPPEEQMKRLVGRLSGIQLLTAYEEALTIDETERESARKVLAQHLHVHRYLDREVADKIAYNCPIFLVEGVIIPASTIPIEALSPVQRFHLKMRWRRKQRRRIPKTKIGDEIRDRELAMNYWLCYTKRKKLTWAIFESMGWCEADVIKGRNKVRPGVRLTNLVGVLTWLREEMELTEEELRRVILDNPILLAHSVESFEARRVFFMRKKIGVSEVTQKEWLMKYPKMFTRPVERTLIPMVYGMIEDFGISDAPELFRKYPSVFVRNNADQLRVKLGLLQNLGFTGEDFSRLIRAQEAGPPQNVLCNGMDERIPPLVKLLKKNGLTQRDAVEVVVSQVPLLAVDLGVIEERIKFLLWDVDRTPQEIAAFPACLKYPIEGKLMQRLVYVKKYGFGMGLGLAELLSPDENEWKAMKKDWRGFGNHPANAAKPENDSKAEELLAHWEEEIEDDPEVAELVTMEKTGLVPMDPIRFAPRRKRRKIPIPKVYNLYEQNRIRMPRDPNYHLKVLEKRLAVGLALDRGEEPPKEITEPVFLTKEELSKPSPYGVKVKKLKRKGPPRKGKSPRKKKGKKPKKPLETVFPGRAHLF